jgi:hypothetical protein
MDVCRTAAGKCDRKNNTVMKKGWHWRYSYIKHFAMVSVRLI